MVQQYNDQSTNTYWDDGQKNKAAFFKVSGFVGKIMCDDKSVYLSCPTCRKKVADEPTGYKCEHCNKVFADCIPTYMMSVKFSDISGNVFMQFPREQAEPIMGGMKAEEFLQIRDDAEKTK